MTTMVVHCASLWWHLVIMPLWPRYFWLGMKLSTDLHSTSFAWCQPHKGAPLFHLLSRPEQSSLNIYECALQIGKNCVMKVGSLWFSWTKSFLIFKRYISWYYHNETRIAKLVDCKYKKISSWCRICLKNRSILAFGQATLLKPFQN